MPCHLRRSQKPVLRGGTDAGGDPASGDFQVISAEQPAAAVRDTGCHQYTGSCGHRLTGLIISVLSLIIVFIILKFVFIIIGRLLRGIAQLPVFKQVNKIGGLIMGAFQGILAVYILFAVLTLQFEPGFRACFQWDRVIADCSRVLQEQFHNQSVVPPVAA